MESLQEVMVIVRMVIVCVCGCGFQDPNWMIFFEIWTLNQSVGNNLLEVVGWKWIEDCVPGIYRYISLYRDGCFKDA